MGWRHGFRLVVFAALLMIGNRPAFADDTAFDAFGQLLEELEGELKSRDLVLDPQGTIELELSLSKELPGTPGETKWSHKSTVKIEGTPTIATIESVILKVSRREQPQQPE